MNTVLLYSHTVVFHLITFIKVYTQNSQNKQAGRQISKIIEFLYFLPQNWHITYWQKNISLPCQDFGNGTNSSCSISLAEAQSIDESWLIAQAFFAIKITYT